LSLSVVVVIAIVVVSRRPSCRRHRRRRRRTIGELDDRSISSTRTLSSFESVDEAQLDEELTSIAIQVERSTWL
jgi:hypothetical protein